MIDTNKGQVFDFSKLARSESENCMRQNFIALTAAFLALCLTADAVSSELVLSSDFRLSDLIQMPGPISHSGLRFEERSYPDDEAREWQVRLQAPASGESPLYDNVKSANFVVQFPTDDAVTLHWNMGSHAEDRDFQPRLDPLTPGTPFTVESFGGRSSDGAMPYFNLESPGGGLIVAVGWSGDWTVSFESLSDKRVRIIAGLKASHFRLRAGEQVRLPSVLVMSYRGPWIDGQNKFRRLTLRHLTPTSHPPMKLMPVAASVHGMFGFNATTESTLTALAADIAALNLPLDTFWLDAGWNEGGFPAAQGNPDADPLRFPRGLRPVGTAVSNAGMRFLVWFEPERAMRGTWLERNHPNWLMSPSRTPPDLRYMETDGFRLLDLGNVDARHWALDSVSKHLREAKISVYRQDFNEYPSYFWHTDEANEEIGLREVRYISGLYEFLDELARRHPGLIIDNCASGGRRIDFEMMRRSVLLWRSDSCWDSTTYPRNVQSMTHGLSHWLPLHGLGSVATDDISLRSGMGACASYAANFRDPATVAALRRHLDRYLPLRPLYAADFYPLTGWNNDPATWLAFQFHDPVTERGIIHAFCGSTVTARQYPIKLQALDPGNRYRITNWDNPAGSEVRGGLELSTSGIEVRAAENSSSAIVLEYVSIP
jgi:alpha-galactosidase